MNISYSIEFLNQNSVVFKLTRTLEDGGKIRQLSPKVVEYNIKDVDNLKLEIPEPYLSAVLAIWESSLLQEESK